MWQARRVFEAPALGDMSHRLGTLELAYEVYNTTYVLWVLSVRITNILTSFTIILPLYKRVLSTLLLQLVLSLCYIALTILLLLWILSLYSISWHYHIHLIDIIVAHCASLLRRVLSSCSDQGTSRWDNLCLQDMTMHPSKLRSCSRQCKHIHASFTPTRNDRKRWGTFARSYCSMALWTKKMKACINNKNDNKQ